MAHAKLGMLAIWSLLIVTTTSCSAQTDGLENKRATAASDGESNGANWPEFRGSGRMGFSAANDLPLSWDESKNVAWKIELPGPGSSTPIVFQDRIYLTAYTGYGVPGESGGSLTDLKRHLLCLSTRDGSTIWSCEVNAELPEEDSIRDHGYAGNSAAADSDGVYAFFGKSGVIAYSHDGEQIWKADVGSSTSGWGSAASPVIHGDLLIINASVESQSLIALNRKTGEEVWKVGDIKESWNTPVIVETENGDEELVVARVGKVLGLNPQTGQNLWECDTDISWYMVPSGVAADGVVYYLGGRSGVAALAVRTGGRGDVTKTHRLWTSQKGSNVTSPVLLDGHLYWMHEKLGIAYCAKAETGELVYEKRMNRGGQVYASAILAGGHVYYLNRSGRAFVVAAKPDFELVSTNELRDGSLFNASPAVSGDKLLIRSDKFLYCLSK